jgi:hypothetical protein
MEGNKQEKNRKRTVKEKDMKRHSIFVCDIGDTCRWRKKGMGVTT